MKRIFIAGAGLFLPVWSGISSKNLETYEWNIVVSDLDLTCGWKKINGHKNGSAVFILMSKMQLPGQDSFRIRPIISLLYRWICINLLLKVKSNPGTDLLTASYSFKWNKFTKCLFCRKRNGVWFMNGLDPGSGPYVSYNHWWNKNAFKATLISFKSSTGGLVAPEFDNKPDGTTNLPGITKCSFGREKMGAQYLLKRPNKNIPYQQLFKQAEQIL